MKRVRSAGEVLAKEYMEPLGISQYQLAKAIGKPPSSISQVVNGKKCISFEMAWLLGKAFGTTAKYWIDLDFDYWLATIDESTMPEVIPIHEESFWEVVGRMSPEVEVLSEYRGALTKIPVRCNKCGHEWLAFPRTLRAGIKCPLCTRGKRKRR